MAQASQHPHVSATVFKVTLAFTVLSIALNMAEEIPSAELFYKDHPDVHGTVSWVMSLSFIALGISSALTLWIKVKPTFEILTSALVQWATTRSSVLSFEIVKPADLTVFKECFFSAERILAYNPPLTLLTNSKDHRSVIYANLMDTRFSYRMIVNRVGANRLCSLRDLWESDHGSIKDEYLKKISAIVYDHAANLHTEIPEWGVLKNDLRGLSFFIIKHADERRTALLYILGEPFANSFVVPEFAIKVTGVRQSNELYTELKALFWKRWNELDGCDDGKYRERSLVKLYTDLHALAEKQDESLLSHLSNVLARPVKP